MRNVRRETNRDDAANILIAVLIPPLLVRRGCATTFKPIFPLARSTHCNTFVQLGGVSALNTVVIVRYKPPNLLIDRCLLLSLGCCVKTSLLLQNQRALLLSLGCCVKTSLLLQNQRACYHDDAFTYNFRVVAL